MKCSRWWHNALRVRSISKWLTVERLKVADTFVLCEKGFECRSIYFGLEKKKIWGKKMWTYIPSLRQKQTCRIQIIFSLGRGKCLLGGPECYFSDWFVYGFHADLLYLGHVNLRWMGCVIKSKILWSLLNEKMEDKKKIVRFVSFVYFSWQLLQVMSRRNWYIDTFVGCVCVQPELGLVSSGTTSSARAIIALFNKYPSLFSDFPLFLIFFFQNILFINNNNSRPKCWLANTCLAPLDK